MTAALVAATITFVTLGFSLALAAIALFGIPDEEEMDSPILRALAARAATLATPTNVEGRAELDELLLQAGYSPETSTERFLQARAGLAILVPAVALGWFGLADLLTMAVIVAMGGAIGYLTPLWYVEQRRTARRARIRRSVPQLMEYTIPLLESGRSVDGVLQHLGVELRPMAPELAAELRRTTSRLDAGLSRHRAFQDLRRRTGVEELDTTLQMLVRAEASGASLLEAIRGEASAARERAIKRTEQRMATRTPMFTVATIVFTLPLMIVLLVGPAVVDATENLVGSRERQEQARR